MRTYLLTGAGNGIAQSIRSRLIADGDLVIETDLIKPEEKPDDRPFFTADLRRFEDLDRIISYIRDKGICLNGLIHTAMLHHGGLDTCTYDQFIDAYKVGVAAPFYLMQKLNSLFAKNAAAVLIGSTRFLMSQPDWESYAAAKGGLYALNHALAMTLAGKVRVNLIAPGWIDSSNRGQFSAAEKRSQPAGRVGTPGDVAALCRFLLSDEAGFITGAVFTVDGGMTRQMIYPGEFGWDFTP